MECLPRFATPRSPERNTRGHEVANVAKLLGMPLMAWQREVANVGLEVDDNGVPYYREIIVSVSRQSGKTSLVLSWMIHRALLWGSRQMVAYGAADGNAARKKLMTDQLPIIHDSKLGPALTEVRRAAGQEALVFRNDSRIEVFGSAASSGHGRSLDLAIADEVWHDSDDRREQALIPAMATRPEAQLVVISTAGTDESIYLRRKVEAGRQAVTEGKTSDICFIEYAADENAPIDDPNTWRSCMPALGYTISEKVVAHALKTMEEDEFRRAFLNQWTAKTERVIPTAAWERVLADVAPDGALVFGVDINPQRSFASIAVVDREGRAELGQYGAGTSWVVGRIKELASKWNSPVALDESGPAGSLVPELEACGVQVIKVAGRDLASACGLIYDAIGDEKLHIRNAMPMVEHLTAAVDAARRRPLGDAWAWTRKDTASDISPLVALTVAYWAACSTNEPPRQYIYSLASAS